MISIILRRGLPYFLLFAIYAIVNSYLPLTLRALSFSASDIGILLGVMEVVGSLVPFFITPHLDKTGRYDRVMILLGIDITLLLLPVYRFHSFFITAICLALFSVGYKGFVPVLDGFTAKALGVNRSQYGKIRALGSVGFVCLNLFLQFTPFISGKHPLSVILTISCTALLLVVTLPFTPDLHRSVQTASLEHTSRGENIADESNTSEVLDISRAAEYVEEEVKAVSFPRPFWESLLLIFLGFLGLVPSQRFFSLYVEEYVKIEASAGLWALSAMAEIPIMIISGRLMQQFRKKQLIVACLVSMMIRNLCYLVLPGLSGAVMGQLLQSISFGLFYPLGVLLSAAHSRGRTATAMTFFTAANGIANVIGSMTGGYIIDYAGYPILFLVFSIFPLIGIGLSFLMQWKQE